MGHSVKMKNIYCINRLAGELATFNYEAYPKNFTVAKWDIKPQDDESVRGTRELITMLLLARVK